MISAVRNSFRELQAIEGLGGVFSEYRETLVWLANFLTGDKNVAEACVIDACALAEAQTPGLQGWPVEWARLATIRSAMEMQQKRIAQLSSVYAHRPCIHGGHRALVQESIEVLVAESDALIGKLDVLCRFALLLCGLEKHSAQKAALLLSIEHASVEGAYCAAVRYLKVIGCEQFRQQNFAAMLN
ncbi:MAG: hypothetical protein JO159_10615 [Acidobacteria bacterium]|nr:hypothetical protein [Acidobacteriota bacterium]